MDEEYTVFDDNEVYLYMRNTCKDWQNRDCDNCELCSIRLMEADIQEIEAQQ